MAGELELLNAEAHRSLRLRKTLQNFPHFVQVVTSEFATVATRCPILLTKNPDNGQFYAGAMYGFKAGENLVPDDPSPYRPLDLERQGFFIAGDSIAIDREHPQFDDQQGDMLFAEDGSPGEPLRHIQRVLGRLKTGVEETDAFIKTLLRHRLVEPIDISLHFDDGETLALQGLYTIGLDSLRELGDAPALELFRQGYLQLAYCMVESLKQIPLLAHRRNRGLGMQAE